MLVSHMLLLLLRCRAAQIVVLRRVTAVLIRIRGIGMRAIIVLLNVFILFHYGRGRRTVCQLFILGVDKTFSFPLPRCSTAAATGRTNEAIAFAGEPFILIDKLCNVLR